MKLNSRIARFTALSVFAVLALSSCRTAGPAGANQPKSFNGATPLEWSVRMADSETTRLGDKRAWRPGRNVKWDYTAGLFTLSLLKLNERVPTPAYVDFSADTIGSFIAPDGNIQGYQLNEYNIDNIAPGRETSSHTPRKMVRP
jgi:unsaturated rhamnogalacturonyl hydrolase